MLNLCQIFSQLSALSSPDDSAYVQFLHDCDGLTPDQYTELLRGMLDILFDSANFCPLFLNAIDVCGTGGSGMNKLNVSTAVAFVLAALNVPVSKHGNRSATSKSGSADVWGELKLPLFDNADDIQQLYLKYNLAFIFAPTFHPILKKWANARKIYARASIFNLLGPVANPTKPSFQLIGTSKREWMLPIAKLLQHRGIIRAWVVHGSDGSDDLIINGENNIIDVTHNELKYLTVVPDDLNLNKVKNSSIIGGTAFENAQKLISLLRGDLPQTDAYFNSVALNAGAGLYITGNSNSLNDGIVLAKKCLKSGLGYNIYNQMLQNNKNHLA